MSSIDPSDTRLEEYPVPPRRPARLWSLAVALALIVLAGAYRYARLRPVPADDPLHGNSEDAAGALASVLDGTPKSQRLALLLKDIHDPSAGLRYAAVDALGAEGAPHDPVVADAIEAAFLDSDSEVRKRAEEVLVNVDPNRGWLLLLAGLRDEDPWIREAASTRLVFWSREHASPAQKRGAVPSLVAALEDPDVDVAQFADVALVRITGQPWRASRLAPRAAREAVAAKWQHWWRSVKDHWPMLPEYAHVGARTPTRTDACPDFAADTLDGQTVALDRLLGHVILVNFWGIGAGPATAELPVLAAIYDRYHARGVDVIGAVVASPEDSESVQKWCGAHGIRYPQVLATPELKATFGHVEDVPVTVLIDQKGRICRVWQGGPRDPEPYSASIERLLDRRVVSGGM